MTEQEKVTAHVPITISIDVDELIKSELGWRTQTIGNGYGDEDEYEYVPGDGRLIDVVADKIAARLQSAIERPVRDAVKEAALAKVDGLIEKIMSEPVQLMSSRLGEPKSPELSMREAMIKAMVDRLDGRVNDNGQPYQRDAFGADRGTSYLQWQAQQVAREVLDKDLTAQLTEAGKQIRSAATDLIGKRIAEVLGKGF